MYSRIVKIIPVTRNGEDNEDVQYGVMDKEKNLIMSGFTSFDEAMDELEYQKEETDKLGTFGLEPEEVLDEDRPRGV